jgi:hypothetical protein
MLRSPLQRVKSFGRQDSALKSVFEHHRSGAGLGLERVEIFRSKAHILWRGAEANGREKVASEKVLRSIGTTVPLTLQLLELILTAVEIYPSSRTVGEGLSNGEGR